MRILRYRILLLAGAALFAVNCAWAQFGIPLSHDDSRPQPAQIREAVAQYCRLDYEGARLDAQGWPKMQGLVSWRANPDFPLVNVISRYTIEEQPVPTHKKFAIAVHYRLKGQFVLGEGFSKDLSSSVEDVVYTLAQVNGEWKIVDIEPNYPHPSKDATLKWLNEQLRKADDGPSKTVYQDAIRDMQAPASPPTPSQ